MSDASDHEKAVESDIMGKMMFAALAPRDRLRYDAFKEATELADSNGHVPFGLTGRLGLMIPALSLGRAEEVVVEFAWCLAHLDEVAEETDPEIIVMTMLEYPWVITSAAAFPRVPKEKLDFMLDDMRRRLAQYGFSPRGAHYACWQVKAMNGELDEAAEAFEAFRVLPRDEIAVCEWCERHVQVEWHVIREQNEEALELAAPMLDEKKCEGVPHATFATLLRPLMRLGRVEQARDFHRRGYRFIEAGEMEGNCLCEAAAEHLLFLTFDGDLDRAVKVFDDALTKMLEEPSPLFRMYWYDTVALLLEVLAPQRASLRLTAPEYAPWRREDASYRTAELAEWFRTEADGLQQRFAERNGNDRLHARFRENRELATSGGESDFGRNN